MEEGYWSWDRELEQLGYVQQPLSHQLYILLISSSISKFLK